MLITTLTCLFIFAQARKFKRSPVGGSLILRAADSKPNKLRFLE